MPICGIAGLLGCGMIKPREAFGGNRFSPTSALRSNETSATTNHSSLRNERELRRMLDDFNALQGTSVFPEFKAKKIFHYTTLAALKGILESRQLWATDVEYMNDSSEYVYAEQLIENTIRALSPPAILDQVPSLLSHDPRKRGLQVYATCFCEKPDLLSQWRAYGGQGTGYCIEFNWQIMEQRLSGEDIFLGRVEYEKSKQIELIQNIVAPHLQSVASRGNDDPGSILRKLALVRAFFKSASFSEEHEWRMACFATTLGIARFRASEDMLVPYVAVPLDDDATGLPIRCITIGPNPHPVQAQESLRRYLESIGAAQIVVDGSLIPLRLKRV